MNNLLALYKKWCGVAPKKIESLEKSGSNRKYIRLFNSEGSSIIGVIGQSVEENHCFIYLAKHFYSQGLPVPRIYAISEDQTCYLQQDLGRTSLYEALAKCRINNFTYEGEEKELLARTIRLLAHIQVKGAQKLDFNQCLSPKHFDHTAAMFDLYYFKYSFLKITDLPFDELRLEEDFKHFANDLVGVAEKEHFFLYRDFQARNVMLDKDRNPYFIDFQGGMQGPLQYDVASFLWQASARYPQTLRNELIHIYEEEISTLCFPFDKESFRQRLHLFVLFRILQVLGAYGLRGYVERKKYFLDSIPLAIQNLQQQLLENSARPYPYLENVLQRMVKLPQFRLTNKATHVQQLQISNKKEHLTVRIFSFSYKKGIPEDLTGNGGGYVFDCRSTHNPGRYEQYKNLTGLDEPVIKFLEDDGEILTFLDSVYKLADAHVSRYIERGFTNLMFSFGCTGGQHRSVYSAQHLAEHLHEKFGIEIILCHREQNITNIFRRKN